MHAPACCVDSELQDAGYQHPVLILSIRLDRTCTFLKESFFFFLRSRLFSDIWFERSLKGRIVFDFGFNTSEKFTDDV